MFGDFCHTLQSVSVKIKHFMQYVVEMGVEYKEKMKIYLVFVYFIHRIKNNDYKVNVPA